MKRLPQVENYKFLRIVCLSTKRFVPSCAAIKGMVIECRLSVMNVVCRLICWVFAACRQEEWLGRNGDAYSELMKYACDKVEAKESWAC